MKKILLLGLFGWMLLDLLSSCNKDTIVQTIPVPGKSCLTSYIYGYCDKASYFPGEDVKAYIQSGTNNLSCRLDIYKITGEVAFSVPATLNSQKIYEHDPSVNGFGFSIVVNIPIPLCLKSGIYLIENQTPFIVKTLKTLDVLVVYPSNTANAYCANGGKSLYTVASKPSFVSFLRPIPVQANAAVGLKWFSALQSFEIGFISDMDMDDYQNLGNAKIISIVGHSEYWTRKARENFDKFVNEGGHALILSGNTMWWQVRYSSNSQMIRYLNPANDPEANTLLKTVNWNETSLQYSILSSIGADFPHGGYGLKIDNGWNGYKIVTPASPLLEGTGLKKGDIINLPSGEYDGAPIKTFGMDGYPILDNHVLNFKKIELIGFDRGSRFGKETIGTFIVIKKSEASGIIVNGASYDWCSERGMGGQQGDLVKRITFNAIEKLLHDKPVFSN